MPVRNLGALLAQQGCFESLFMQNGDSILDLKLQSR